MLLTSCISIQETIGSNPDRPNHMHRTNQEVSAQKIRKTQFDSSNYTSHENRLQDWLILVRLNIYQETSTGVSVTVLRCVRVSMPIML
jgi:hypothetical protein